MRRSEMVRRVWGILSPWRGTLAVVLGLMAAGTAAGLAPALLLRRVIDEQLTAGRSTALLGFAVLYFGAGQLSNALRVGQDYLMAVVAQGALHRLRVRLFEHYQRLPIAYFDRTPLGDAISRCTSDVETVETLFSKVVGGPIENAVRLIFAGAAMVALSPALALIAGLTVPPLASLTNAFRVRVRSAEDANRRASSLLNTRLQETLAGVEVVRAFGREAEFAARFRRALQTAIAAFDRSTVYSSLYPPTMALLSALTVAALLWAGAARLLAGVGISLGTLTAFVLLYRTFFTVVGELGDDWQTVQAAFSGLERIGEVLGMDVEQLPHMISPPDTTARLIDVRNIVFGYDPARPVLHGVSLAVQTGEHVALVGRTGAGKSSIVQLLGGLYAPWSGSVRVAGLDPQRLSDDERRRVIGVVPQTVQLFGGTLRDNLTMGDDAAPPEAVERAAEIAGVRSLALALPRGYDTPLAGDGRGAGVQLSAGQRQLVSLARALLWEPRALLLDEATSAVDGASEAAFRAALQDRVLARGGAVLTVAHRLASARESDRVVVLEAGRVVEAGPPAALLAAGGRFAALVALEEAGWDWQRA